MTFVIEKLASVTTDMGTELLLVDVPNILPAFVQRLDGWGYDGATGGRR